MTSGPWLDVVLVAPVRIGRVGDQLRARVIEHELGRRLGPVSCRWATTIPDGAEPAWVLDAATLPAEPRPDVLVVAAGIEIDTAAWEGVGPPPTIEYDLRTDGSGTDPVRLHPLAADPMATGIRAGMLRHLGLLPSGPYALHGPSWRIVTDAAPEEEIDLAGLRPTATDLAVLAAFATGVEIDPADDPGLVALAGCGGEVPTGTDLAAIAAEFDDLARRLTDAVETSAPETTVRRIRALTAQLDDAREALDAERMARRAERERAVAALDAAADRERILRARLEAAELQAER